MTSAGGTANRRPFPHANRWIMLLNKTKRDLVVADAVHRMHKFYDGIKDPNRGPISHYCLFWAVSTIEAMRAVGLNCQLQAGSAFWTSVRPEDDDGSGHNQYGYQFELNNATINTLMKGLLPEMHVWVAVMNLGNHEIVDLTAPFFKDRCIAHGGRWTMPDPPPYFWSDEENFPRGVCHYEPDWNATHAAHQILKSIKSGGGPTVMEFRVPR